MARNEGTHFFSAFSTKNTRKELPNFNSQKDNKDKDKGNSGPVSNFSPTEKIKSEINERMRLIDMPELSKIERDLYKAPENWLYQYWLESPFVISSDYLLSSPNLFEMPFSTSRFFNSHLKCTKKIRNDLKQRQILFFESQLSERYLIKREWFNYKNNNNAKNSKNEKNEKKGKLLLEEIEQWVVNQIKKYAVIKFAGENENFIPPLDFYLVKNSSLNVYISEIVFKIPSQTIKDVYQKYPQEKAKLLLKLSEAVKFLSFNEVHFKAISEECLYIDSTSEALKLKILPLSLILNTNLNSNSKNINGFQIKGKENNNSLSNQREKKLMALNKNNLKISKIENCNFDSFLTSLISEIASSFINFFLKEKDLIGNGQIYKKDKDIESKEKLYEMCKNYVNNHLFKIEEFYECFKLIHYLDIDNNYLHQERNRIIQHEKRKSNSQAPREEVKKQNWKSQFDNIGDKIEFQSPHFNPTSYFQENKFKLSRDDLFTLNHADEKLQQIPKSSSSLNDRSPKNENQEGKQQILNESSFIEDDLPEEKNKNFSKLSQETNYMKLQVDKNMKFRQNKLIDQENFNNFYLYYDSFISENDIQMRLIHNKLIQFFSLNRKEILFLFNSIKTVGENFLDQFFEEFSKVQKKFEDLYNYFPEIIKPQVDLHPVLPSFTQKWNDEGKIYIGRNIHQEKREIGMLVINPNRIFLGEFAIENHLKMKSGIGTIIKLNQNSLHKKLFFGEFKNNLKNGLGIKYSKNGRYFIGNYTNGKKDGYGIFFSNNGTFSGGVFLQGKITNQGIKGDGRGQVYKGILKNDREDGEGELIWANQDKYIGEFSNGEIEGQGKLIKKNGEYYHGTFHEGIFTEGFGKKELENGDIYEGHFSYEKYNGEGKLTYANGEVYEGMFINNKREGKGSQTYPNNGYYQGYWYNNEYNGVGKRCFSDKYYYEGLFKSNEYNGKGKLVNENGDVYNGDWIMGEKNGTGLFISASGKKYEGEFINNEFHGKGKLTEKNYEYYGDWVRGMKSGQGKLIYSNNVVYEGSFDNNQFNGEGTLVDEKGNTYKGNWINGKLFGKGQFSSLREGFYEGDFQENYFHGKGTLIDKDQNKYEGFWVMSKKVGFFKLFHASGITLEATYDNDIFVGKKTVTCPNPSPITYKGDIGKSTEKEIIDLFVSEDSNQYKIKENPSLNGNNEISYNNGDYLQGRFINGFLIDGRAKLLFLNLNNNNNNQPAKIYRQHIEVENNKIFSNPCIYDGEILNGQLSGEGSITYLDSEKILNNFKNHIKFNEIKEAFQMHLILKAYWEKCLIRKADKFLIVLKDKTIYLGAVEDNKFHGEGRMFYPNGNYFEGTFINDKFEKGKGLASLPDKTSYEGEYVNGVPFGQGRIITSETIYEGEVLNFLMHGRGKRTYISIEKYNKYFIQNSPSNDIRIFFSKNASFTGIFEKDLIVNGEGTLVLDKGIYNGQIENGFQSGLGSMYYYNGDSYSGCWKSNLYHGKGEYKAYPSNVISGMWIEGKPEREIKNFNVSKHRIMPFKPLQNFKI